MLDKNTKLMILAISGLLIVDVVALLSGIDAVAGTHLFWSNVMVIISLFFAPTVYDAMKSKSKIITNPILGRVTTTSLTPIDGTDADDKMPSFGLWGFGGVEAYGFSLRDGGTPFRAGGYILAPKWHAIREGNDVLHLTSILHEVPHIGAFPKWAQTAIGKKYDSIKSKFYIGLYSTLEPHATPENLDIQRQLEHANMEVDEFSKIAEDAMTRAQDLFDVALQMRSGKYLSWKQKRLEERLRKQLEEEEFGE